MPIVHYRRPAFDNPLSNIFGPGPTTTATTPTPAGPASTAATIPILSDPLGGLTSAVASILSPTSSLPTTSSLVPTTPSTTSTSTSTSNIPTTSSTPTSIPPTTVDVTSTITSEASQASATTSPSPSPSATDTPTSHSTVAAAIVGSLVGVFALALMISFFLRRWNRSRSRVRPRESINFNRDEFRRSAVVLKDNHSARFTEQKGYPASAYRPDSAYQISAMAASPQAGPFTPEYSYQQPQQMYAPAPYPQQQQIYSPNPHHTYPTAAQQVAFEYRGATQAGAPDTNMPVEHPEAMPNPHPVTHAEDEGAYGGI